MILTNNITFLRNILIKFYNDTKDVETRKNINLLKDGISSSRTRSTTLSPRFFIHLEQNFKDIFSAIINHDSLKEGYVFESVNFISVSDKLAIADTSAFFIKAGEVNALPVFSIFPKNIYDLFSKKIVVDPQSTNDYRIRLDSDGSNEYFFEQKDKSDVKYNNYRFLQALFINTSTLLTEELRQSFSSDRTKYTVIQTKSVCTGSNIDYSIKEVKASKFKKVSNCIIPVLYKSSYYNHESSKFEDCYVFGFVFDIDEAKWLRYKKPQKIYNLVAQSLYDFDLMDLIDSQAFYETLISKISLPNKALSKSNINFYLNYTKNLNLDFNEFEAPASCISHQTLLDIYSDIKYPEDFLNKYNIIKMKMQESKEAQKKIIEDYSASINDFYFKFLKPIHVSQNVIEAAKRIIEEKQRIINRSIETKEHLLEKIDSFNPGAKSHSSDLNKELAKSNKYLPAYEALLSQREELSLSLPREANQTLGNLLNDITIIDINFKHKTDSSIVRNVQADDLDDYVINELIFCNNSFMKIRKNNSNDYYLGGPYIFKYSSNSLRIKLKDKTSYFGLNDTRYDSTYIIHPHASGTTHPEEMYQKYSACCLGESQSMIYKAASTNNINYLIINILLWARSCNSIDTWGRNYKYFQKFTDDHLEMLSFVPLKEEVQIKNLTLPEDVPPIQETESNQDIEIQPQGYTRYVT